MSCMYVHAYTHVCLYLYIDLSPPSNVSLVSMNPLIFNWSEVSNDCPARPVKYKINATNCGECPRMTSDTSVTCHDMVSMDQCHFAVHAVICGDMVGSPSVPVILNESTVTTKLTTPTSPVTCLLYTSPSPRDATLSRMPSSA